MKFILKIGYEESHVHFLIQSVPTLSVSKICIKVKSIIAKKFSNPEVKRNYWVGIFGPTVIMPIQLDSMETKMSLKSI